MCWQHAVVYRWLCSALVVVKRILDPAGMSRGLSGHDGCQRMWQGVCHFLWYPFSRISVTVRWSPRTPSTWSSRRSRTRRASPPTSSASSSRASSSRMAARSRTTTSRRVLTPVLIPGSTVSGKFGSECSLGGLTRPRSCKLVPAYMADPRAAQANEFTWGTGAPEVTHTRESCSHLRLSGQSRRFTLCCASVGGSSSRRSLCWPASTAPTRRSAACTLHSLELSSGCTGCFANANALLLRPMKR